MASAERILSLITASLGKLIHTGQLSKVVCSYIGTNKHFESQYLAGKVSIELCPQGTLAERIRAAGAGIPAFFTPTGYGTAVESGELPVKYKEDGSGAIEVHGKRKEVREFSGRNYIMEEALYVIHMSSPGPLRCANLSDKLDTEILQLSEFGRPTNMVIAYSGSSSFYPLDAKMLKTLPRYTQHNFSGAMARSARVTIVEVRNNLPRLMQNLKVFYFCKADEIVPAGSLDPQHVHLPGIYVDRVVKSNAPKEIEFRITSPAPSSASRESKDLQKDEDTVRRERIAKRAAKELKDGFYVNLGRSPIRRLSSLSRLDVSS